jgi:hypothetical protein
MTVLQIYSFFVVLGIAGGMYWLNAREGARLDRESRDHR